MKTMFFDIETVPLPEDELRRLAPEFKPEEVKLGNVKDEQKILEKLADAKTKLYQDFADKAALNANSGRVAMIGLLEDGKFGPLTVDDEAAALTVWWELVSENMGAHNMMCGFNIKEFDLPFLVRRSWKLGVHIPLMTVALERKYPFWHECFIDLREMWLMGERSPDKGTSSLNDLAKFFGLKTKEGNGKDFWKMDRKSQLKYLEHDVRLCEKIHKQMYQI